MSDAVWYDNSVKSRQIHLKASKNIS